MLRRVSCKHAMRVGVVLGFLGMLALGAVALGLAVRVPSTSMPGKGEAVLSNRTSLQP